MNSIRLQDKYAKINDIYVYLQQVIQNEIQKSIPFTVASKIIKYLGMNFQKEVQNVYSEDFKHNWEKLI